MESDEKNRKDNRALTDEMLLSDVFRRFYFSSVIAIICNCIGQIVGNVATQIQASMLPCIFPAFPNRDEFDIFATMTPAKEVGGDFYDFFMVDDNHIAMVMADVSGKGVPAALFMVIAKTLIKDHTYPGANLGDVFTDVNKLLCESNSGELFVTAFDDITMLCLEYKKKGKNE